VFLRPILEHISVEWSARPSGIPEGEFRKICLHKIPGGNSRKFMHIDNIIIDNNIKYQKKLEPAQLIGFGQLSQPL